MSALDDTQEAPQSRSRATCRTLALVGNVSLLDLGALGLAWARAMPTMMLVPTAGLRALSAPARGAFGIALAAGFYPAMNARAPALLAQHGTPWILLVAEQIVAGLPVALAATIPLWAVTMAGGLVDTLRGSLDPEKESTFGVFFSLFASFMFLATGGASRAATALAVAQREGGANPLIGAAHDIVAGVSIAVAMGGPLLAAAVVLELASALVARATSPAQVHFILAPLRALGLLAVVAIVLERLASLIGSTVRTPL